MIAEKNIAVKIGRSVKITCLITGFPKPAVIWGKDGNILLPRENPSPRYQVKEISKRSKVEWENSFHIMNTIRNDSGHYVCVAMNGVGGGTSWSPTQLTILGK